MYQVYLFGYPITTSWSPRMHAAAFKACNMSGEYIVMSLPSDALQGAVVALRHENVLGANVTMPYKEKVMSMLDEIHPQAARLGAVNTIVNRDGWLTGHNTDISGAEVSLCAYNIKGKDILLCGAGGAARAALGALCREDFRPKRVVVVNRTAERILNLEPYLRTLPYTTTPRTPDAADLDELTKQCALLINATTGGALWSRLSFSAPIWDLNYGHKSDILRHYAREHDVPYTDGSLMLAAQAQKSFALWTGQELSLDIFLWELRSAL